MKKLTLLFAIIVLMMSSAGFAQKTWTGATSTSWNTAGNWSPGGVPGSTDNVVIPSAPANQPVINGTTSPVCNNLTVNSGATLTISATSLANGQLTVAGTATFNGALSIGGLLTKTGKIIATNIIWNSTATIAAGLNARCEVSGNWTFSSGSSIDMGWCWVTLTGTGNSTITNNSANSKFSSLTLGKTATAITYIEASSTATLTVTGTLTINANNTLSGAANITTILQSNLVSNGLFKFDYGTVSFERASGTQEIQMATTGNCFNSLKINCGGTVTINNSLSIQGNLTIQSGTFNPQNNTLYVTGDWINTAGPACFTEGTGKVVFNVIINKDGGRDYDNIIQNSENFNILELNNAYGDLIINSGLVVVTCNHYDWVAGGLNVSQGVFTALDLVDNGLFGRYYVSGTGTINVTNNDGYVDLCGNVNITGGTMNVYGGTTESYWPYTNNAWITMSNGTLNFADQGVRVTESALTLTSSITGGTIKTAKNFSNYRSDFNPTGGTIEMYGPTDASLYCVGTAALYGVKINKTASKDGENTTIIYQQIDRETGEVLSDETRAQIVTLTSPITFNGNFTLTSGTFNSNSHTIQAKRDWTNNAGPGSFNPGTGRVIFNGGNYHQVCYNETFNILEVAKASGGAFRVTSGNVNCAQYDWTIGSVDVLGGTFTASDLYENGLYGGFYVNPGGTINLYQDIYQYIDLNGSLTFTNGGTINIYGGNGASQWALGANASVTMNAGTLDFKDQGITLTTLSPNTITENISGGTIRTTGGFFCNRADFTPVGGLLELYGSDNVALEQYAGTLRDIKINKDPSAVVTVNSNITVVSIEVTGGTLSAVNKIINQDGHLYVENGGIFSLGESAQLKIATDMSVNVNSGGIFSAIGTAVSPAIITRSTSNFYYFNVNNGGTISAKYAQFLYSANIILATNSIIDPTFPFDYCTFANGQGTYIFLNNNQELTIKGANFPTLPPTNTVAKTANTGHIIFKDATGAYAGPSYEYDPYNLIDWTVTQTGLWTGAVSTDWHTADNWDDNTVPTSATNVTIPADAVRMPVISNGFADCDHLTLLGTLTIQDKELNVAGSADIGGNLTMNHDLGALSVQGNINWNSGSTATISSGYIRVYGNWNFNEGSNAQLALGSVLLKGEESQSITVHSENVSFNDLYIEKENGGLITFNPASTSPIKSNGFYVSMGASFTSDCTQDIIVTGNLYSFGNLTLNDGSVVFNGADHLIIPNVDNYYNNLVFNQTGTVTINQINTDTLIIKGDLTINSGIFSPETSTLKLGESWINNFGPDAFNEGNSRVTFNGAIPQFCSTEEFYILEIDKPLHYFYDQTESNIFCQIYDWTQGGMWIAGGSTFHAADLADDGIYGDFVLWWDSIELHQDALQSIDLHGSISVNGGEFRVYGGNDQSLWGTHANANLFMGSGVLDFVDQGIKIQDAAPYSFTSTISGGTIRTQKSFIAQSPGFNPTGGTVELYGPQNGAILTSDGSAFYNVYINKPSDFSTRAAIWSSIVKNNFVVAEGLAEIGFDQELECWNSIEIEDSGWLATSSSTISMKYLSSINVYANGRLSLFGYEGAMSRVKGMVPGEQFTLSVLYGGYLEAMFTIFENLPEQGVYLASGAVVNPNYSFTNCEFRNGMSGPTTLMSIDSEQDIIIENAVFPTNTWGGQYNVRKLVDAGSVTFVNATGDFAGSDFENDPFNRIF